MRSESKTKQVKHIVDVLFSDNQGGCADSDFLRGWLVDDENSEEKDSALRDQFDKTFAYNAKPVRTPELWTEMESRIDAAERHRSVRKHANYRLSVSRAALMSAAITVIVMVLGFFAYHKFINPQPADAPMMYARTDSLGEQGLVLPDGTKVWLAKSSSMEWSSDFSTKRAVKLDGRAWFAVEKDATRPFEVTTEHLTVDVTGTQFDISDYAHTPESGVTLVSGSLTVETAHSDEKHTLVPGQRLDYDKQTGLVQKEAVAATDWRTSKVELDDLSVEEALKHIAGLFDMKLHIDTGLALDMQLVISLNNDMTLSQILDILQSVTGTFSYQVSESEIIITAKKISQ
jgi:ferric-dicitrate binding protein FerR (iron transport regulator)